MMSRPSFREAGFTILELLIVLGLVAALTFVISVTLTGGRKAVALEAGQASLVQLVTSARTRALAANTTVRLLIRNRVSAQDYRRMIVIVQDVSGTWQAVDSVVLPENIYVLPYRTRIPAGMYPVASEWRNAANTEVLGSSALNGSLVDFAFDAGTESWEYFGFTANGTVQPSQGSLIVAVGRPVSPTATSDSPVVMTDPSAARGVQISTYGLPRLINDRTGF